MGLLSSRSYLSTEWSQHVAANWSMNFQALDSQQHLETRGSLARLQSLRAHSSPRNDDGSKRVDRAPTFWAIIRRPKVSRASSRNRPETRPLSKLASIKGFASETWPRRSQAATIPLPLTGILQGFEHAKAPGYQAGAFAIGYPENWTPPAKLNRGYHSVLIFRCAGSSAVRRARESNPSG